MVVGTPRDRELGFMKELVMDIGAGDHGDMRGSS
jgi:hypothetical protein